MRRTQYAQASSAWQAQVVNLLLETLPLVDYGRSVTRSLLARTLVWMSVVRSTVAAAPRRFGISASDETLRKAVRASLPEIDQLPRLLEASLSAAQRRWLQRARRKRGFDVAIDLHHQPYYGKKQAGVFRGQAKLGTKHFWSIATAAIVYRGERLTLAQAPVFCNRMQDVLEALWPQLQSLGVKVRRLLLDRGFYSAPVVSWLQARRLAFLMPMIRRGRAPRKGHSGTGTAPFFVRGRKGLETYTWKQRKSRRKVTVQVAIVPPQDRRCRPLVFVYAGRLPNLRYAAWLYKKRFGIETTYRQARQSRGWTTSRDERWRRLLIVLSFVIQNVWLLLRGDPQRTPRRQRLTYALFLDLLIQTLRQELSQLTPGAAHDVKH